MSDTSIILLIVGDIALLAAAIYLGIFVQKQKTQSIKQVLKEKEQQWERTQSALQDQINELKEDRADLQSAKEGLAIRLSRKETDLENLQKRNEEHKKEVEDLQKQFSEKFQLLANRILEEKSKKFTDQNQENIKNLLGPLQEKIQLFEKRVESTNKESIERHSMLQEQLKNLRELNQQITREASNLTRALKGDTKMQGNWGELVLERVLEKSGLEKGSEYTVQNSFLTDEGRRVLPDVIIHLPDDKKMVVDSKVSLVAYEQYVNEEDELEKKKKLKEHLQSIKKHVDQLSNKNYHQLYEMESPDFVLLFIPLEPAFAMALQEEPQLYNAAFEKNIVIVTPTTLLATLRTIDSMWQNDKQHKNALSIASEAGKLYDKFTDLLSDLEKVGNQLNTVKNTYDSSMKKLTGRGNLLKKVQNLKDLGAKASKQIDNKWLDRAED
ncbi:DNA recombination protein RmuC [Robertkochia aurantiaca]|uniref:DNA recombination protein RmuC n=1 Tax=Robertkochia aurantiaca TaxID=2873700 RepID=UPI001CCA5987|nr:DNA recombination protein RmuC [Robertkochia sp. 3YJGBD-33]